MPRDSHGHEVALANPSMYEQACLREVLRALAEIGVDDPKDRVPINIHSVGLEGRHPETKLVLALSRQAAPTVIEWRLWGDDFGEVPEGGPRPSPESVAAQVELTVWEF